MVSQKTIMVVEDDAVSRLMMSRFLEIKGYAICTAENGQAALDALSKGVSPDAILMDIQMPVLDGLETTRAIREGQVKEIDPHIPIIAVTAHAMYGERDRILALGMDDFMPKPVDIDAVIEILERLIS